MFEFFKKENNNKAILLWATKVSRLINENLELKSKIEQEGILNGYKIISEYLENNETGLAYEHLIFMIQETGIYLNDYEVNEITLFSTKIGLEKPNLKSPTWIEIDEFYRITKLFNLAQQKVVSNLIEIWDMKTPIKPNNWIVWSQDRYEKDEFKNEEGIKIFPHGFGLSYHDSETHIDFDFGEEGEINGFNLNRIWAFIEANKIKTIFISREQLKRVLDNELKLEKVRFSDYINYYLNTI